MFSGALMVKMSQEVMDFVEGHRPALVATISPDGMPNVAPKGSLTVMDEEHLVFADLVAGRTSRNIVLDPHIAVVVLSEDGKGFQLRGRGRMTEDVGSYVKACNPTSAIRIELPPPQAVVVIEIEAIDEVSPPRSRPSG
jgi:uncharacterized protein